MSETFEKFLNRVAESAGQSSMVKMTLSKPAQKNDELRNVYVKPVLIKDKLLYAFTYRYVRRDEVKNYDVAQMLEMLREMLPSRFLNAVLFTVDEDVTLLVSSKGKATIQTKKVKEERERNLDHDKTKNIVLDPNSPCWFHLGLTTREGAVKADMQHKFKQICKYAEIVESLVKPVRFKNDTVAVADMGAGKGYLTFALREVLTQKAGLHTIIKGVELRAELVDKINAIISQLGINDMEFVQGSIAAYKPTAIDVLVALHACDTATDDAIAMGINNNAQLIICAPCCHKQIRREMEKSGKKDELTRFGIFMERQAAMITDAIRAMALEYCGYKVQIMEFIEMEDTPKNILLVAQKHNKKVDKTDIVLRINALKQQYGIAQHYIEKALNINFGFFSKK